MYHSDHELYTLAKERSRDMLKAAEAERLASLGRSGSRPRRVLLAKLGALMVGVGQKLQEK